MIPRTRLFTSLLGAMLIVAPAALADGGHGSDDNGGSSGSGNSGNSGNSSTSVANAQRTIRDGADAAERVIKQEKDARVRLIFGMRAAGAGPSEVSAAVSTAIAAFTAATSNGILQVNNLKASLLANLPATATARQRATIQSAAAAGVAKLNKRLRSATQDIQRASRARIPAGTQPMPHHPFPEHGPGHP
ncbi:MAG: hypothetical protein Q8L55_01465 [Phycisphaerales bacterium]|nr:hypothetical protein [Phycisphaerales bacterium]